MLYTLCVLKANLIEYVLPFLMQEWQIFDGFIFSISSCSICCFVLFIYVV